MSEAIEGLPVERVVGPRYTLSVPVGGGATHQIPNPVADPHLEWMLRYAHDLKLLDDKRNSVRLAAASVLDGFEYLCSDHISMKEATRRLRLLRAARRAALKPNDGAKP
jgi:hypothetical protein